MIVLVKNQNSKVALTAKSQNLGFSNIPDFWKRLKNAFLVKNWYKGIFLTVKIIKNDIFQYMGPPGLPSGVSIAENYHPSDQDDSFRWKTIILVTRMIKKLSS